MKAVYVTDVTFDKVGADQDENPNGIPDIALDLSELQNPEEIASIEVTGPGVGWRWPGNGLFWIMKREGDRLFLAPTRAPLTATVRYQDGSFEESVVEMPTGQTQTERDVAFARKWRPILETLFQTGEELV